MERVRSGRETEGRMPPVFRHWQLQDLAGTVLRLEAWEAAADLSLPLKVSVETARRWGDMH